MNLLGFRDFLMPLSCFLPELKELSCPLESSTSFEPSCVLERLPCGMDSFLSIATQHERDEEAYTSSALRRLWMLALGCPMSVSALPQGYQKEMQVLSDCPSKAKL